MLNFRNLLRAKPKKRVFTCGCKVEIKGREVIKYEICDSHRERLNEAIRRTMSEVMDEWLKEEMK